MFLFYLEIVNKMRQMSVTISEFTHSISIKQPCERCDIKIYMTVYSHQFLNFVKFILKKVENCSSSMQAVEITL